MELQSEDYPQPYRTEEEARKDPSLEPSEGS